MHKNTGFKKKLPEICATPCAALKRYVHLCVQTKDMTKTERFQFYMLESALDIEFQVEYDHEEGTRSVHISAISIWGSDLHMDRIPAPIMEEIEEACLRVHDKKRAYAT